jgi:hypothetical protein
MIHSRKCKNPRSDSGWWLENVGCLLQNRFGIDPKRMESTNIKQVILVAGSLVIVTEESFRDGYGSFFPPPPGLYVVLILCTLP